MSARGDAALCFLAALTVCLGFFLYGIFQEWWGV